MGSRLGRRVVHFANLPIRLLMPSPPFESIREIALKTIPSATKIEIRRVLESLYGFQVEDVHTLNMEGKKKKRGPFLAAMPDYKKAYVTLRTPLSLNPNLFPIRWIQEDRDRIAQAASTRSRKPAVVAEGEGKERQSHWLDESDKRKVEKAAARGRYSAGRKDGGGGQRGRRGGGGPKRERRKEEESKFPWSSMRKWS
ncbi:50S ribosomal protein L23, chloroplastic [Apostasia shenzhenica]|uniref:Large ribosomal subunit protein uL23m n=1 Tax=Apostasia shenzhenica TaxID=1088818 RepID=A0A2I0A1W7_9ASPA|nr:50S ribosomal protein L23, chloroplastic [Apostasia shenzhenica]